MGGLYDRVVVVNAARRRRVCHFLKFFLGLQPHDRADLRRALADPLISGESILSVLRTRGYLGTSATVIFKHRNKRSTRRCVACAENPKGLYAREEKSGKREK